MQCPYISNGAILEFSLRGKVRALSISTASEFRCSCLAYMHMCRPRVLRAARVPRHRRELHRDEHARGLPPAAAGGAAARAALLGQRLGLRRI